MSRLIVADAGPLIALGKLDHIALLPKLFSKVLAPESVIAECLDDVRLPGAQAVQNALAKKLVSIVADPEGLHDQSLGLDAGERAAVLTAQKLHAHVLVDEKRGRDVAQKMGVGIIGTIGVIVLARERELIPEAKSLLMALTANGYYVGEALLKAALKRCVE